MTEQKYTCSECARDFGSEAALNSHRGQIHDTRITLTCSVCGEDFEVVESESDREACSVECGREVQASKITGDDNPRYSESVEKECGVCGSTFSVIPSASGDRRTCSKSCLAVVQSDEFAGEGNPQYNDDFDVEAAISDYQDGLTTHQIAEKQGVSDVTVRNRLHNEGVDLERSPMAAYNYETVNGEQVRSSYEKKVADWLAEHGIEYEYEPDFPGPFTPDFVVGDNLVVEVWGWNSEEYQNRRQRKSDWYDENGYSVIDVDPVGSSITTEIEQVLVEVIHP